MAGSMHSEPYRRLLRVLIDVRKQAGLTQAELGARLNKPQSFVSKLERGERRVDLLEFCDIAMAIGWSPQELFKAVLTELAVKD